MTVPSSLSLIMSPSIRHDHVPLDEVPVWILQNQTGTDLNVMISTLVVYDICTYTFMPLPLACSHHNSMHDGERGMITLA